MRFGRKANFAPRFIGPYHIIRKIGPLAYDLALPEELDRIYNVFHVSVLWVYIGKSNQVIQLDEIKLERDLTFVEQPSQIMDRKYHWQNGCERG